MLFFLRSNGAVTTTAGETQSLASPIPVTQGGTPQTNIQFINDASLIFQPDQSPNVITSLKFIGKNLGDYYGTPVISNYNGSTFAYTASGSGSAAVYSLPVAYNTLGLLQLILMPAAIASTPATITARYALTGLTNGQIVQQLDTLAWWTVTDHTNLSNAAGWTAGLVYASPADQTARYALTGIANGTIVVQADTGIPWIVVDATQLTVAAGWSADVPAKQSVDLGCQIELNTNAGTVLESQAFTLRIFATYITGTEGLTLTPYPTYPAPGQLALDTVGADVASATTTNIGAANAGACKVTGSVTITAFDTVAAGPKRFVTFSGAPLLTNASNLLLPTAANIQAAAGDTALFESLGSGNWICLFYQRANGHALAETLTLTNAVTLTNKTLGSGSLVTGATPADYFSAAEGYPANKALVRQAMLAGNFMTVNSAKIASSNTSHGTFTASSDRSISFVVDGTASSYCQAFIWGAGGDFAPFVPDGTLTAGNIPFGKPYHISAILEPYLTTSTAIFRLQFCTSADLSSGPPYGYASGGAGIGFQLTKNSSSLVNVQSWVANTSGTTNSTAGTLANGGAVIAVELYSDGAGNWKLFGNGALLGAGTGAPTATDSGGNVHFIAQLSDATGGSTQTVVMHDLKLAW